MKIFFLEDFDPYWLNRWGLRFVPCLERFGKLFYCIDINLLVLFN